MLQSLALRKKKVRDIVRILRKLDPHPKIALRYKTPWQLLVAVQLSAQCTDKLVNTVTPALFKKYKTLHDYAAADPAAFNADIRKITFHNNKTRNILAAAKKVEKEFRGKLPKTMAAMTSIPGIGRKSANIVLGIVHKVYAGIPVDTHVRRLSKQLGLTDHADPVKIERNLMEAVPKAYWPFFNYLLVDYGRAYCPGRPHDHAKKNCPLKNFYV